VPAGYPAVHAGELADRYGGVVMTTRIPARRDPERGSAMVLTMILVCALLAGAASLVSVQLTSTRSTELAASGDQALFCAESGLAAAMHVVAANYAQWSATLATASTTEPTWLSAGIGSHDLDGDGRPDFAVYIKDNEDEAPPSPNDPTRDNDLRVFVVARCIAHPETPREVEALVQISGGGTCYDAQLGGCSNENNAN
jgi:hypothetical protein